jgi:hypothetical protein
MMIAMHFSFSFSDILVSEVLLHVEDSFIAFSGILSGAVILVDGGGERSEDQTGVGDGEAGTTFFLDFIISGNRPYLLEVPGTSISVELDGVVFLVVDSDTSLVLRNTIVGKGFKTMILSFIYLQRAQPTRCSFPSGSCLGRWGQGR